MRAFFLNAILLALAGAFILAGAGCRNHGNDLLPQPLTDTIPIKIPVSNFRIPISIPLSELANFLNAKFRGNFFEMNFSPTKNEKDRVKVEMKKLQNIRISAKGDKIVCLIPLDVTATILNSRVNFITKGMAPVKTSMILEFQTPAKLDSNWNLVTKFKLGKVTWIKKPVMKAAGISFNLTKTLDTLLEKNKDKLSKMLDAEINKTVSLQKPVGKIWTDLQKPILILKKEPMAYIKFICQDISADIKLINQDLVCYTNILAKAAMVTKTKLQAAVVPLPRLKTFKNSHLPSDAYVYCFAEFERLNDELAAKLVGKKFTGQYLTTTIKSLKTYASDSGLTVLMKTKGDIDATMAATVQPRFDSVAQTFVMENFQFAVVSKNVLVNVGDAILHDKVRDTVQTFLALGIDSLINTLPSIIEGAVAKGKTGKAIDLNVQELKILSCDVNMDAKRLHLLVHVQIKSSILLKRLNPGKGIRIKVHSKKTKAKT